MEVTNASGIGHFVKLHRMLENVKGTFYVLDSSLTGKEDIPYFQFMKDLCVYESKKNLFQSCFHRKS